MFHADAGVGDMGVTGLRRGALPTLSYTGATVSTNRAVTIGGAGGGTIQATTAATTLTLTGGIATAGNPATFAANTGKIDRKSGVEGKSVDLGGRRIIKKKKKKNKR